mmetsp:Transcript_41560/g.65958  ORF Transcript_41560/g.65958 Transcript_41560/m.65958 type:complete len:238 (-) Transcript_41560:2-715(-)
MQFYGKELAAHQAPTSSSMKERPLADAAHTAPPKLEVMRSTIILWANTSIGLACITRCQFVCASLAWHPVPNSSSCFRLGAGGGSWLNNFASTSSTTTFSCSFWMAIKVPKKLCEFNHSIAITVSIIENSFALLVSHTRIPLLKKNGHLVERESSIASFVCLAICVQRVELNPHLPGPLWVERVLLCLCHNRVALKAMAFPVQILCCLHDLAAIRTLESHHGREVVSSSKKLMRETA